MIYLTNDKWSVFYFFRESIELTGHGALLLAWWVADVVPVLRNERWVRRLLEVSYLRRNTSEVVRFVLTDFFQSSSSKCCENFFDSPPTIMAYCLQLHRCISLSKSCICSPATNWIAINPYLKDGQSHPTSLKAWGSLISDSVCTKASKFPCFFFNINALVRE